MSPKRWMIVVWAGIIVVIIGVCAIYGGRNCEVPKSGPLKALLAGRKFVPSNGWRSGGCVEVSSDGAPFPLRIHR